MKKITSDCCDICGFHYKTKEECQQCEEFHKKPEKVEYTGYRPMSEAQIPYPELIIISMEDKNMVSYTFKEIVPVDGKEEEVE